MKRLLALATAAVVVSAACGGSGDSADPADAATTDPASDESEFGPPPEVPDGELAEDAAEALDDLIGQLDTTVDTAAIARLGDTGDARLAWILTDLQRFLTPDSESAAETRFALRSLTGVVAGTLDSYSTTVDHLLAWDLPAYPGYREDKGALLSLIEPAWEPFFAEESEIDHRPLQWGGVFIDARPFGAPDPVTGQATSGETSDDPRSLCPRGCIPALDDPAVTDAAGGSWYSDDGIVFGVVLDGEARAYPRHIMEIHEMVNDGLGGSRIAMPYCTLCGSAQVYVTDEDTVLRTSGLLTRSNKVMYELGTSSVFDTFTGLGLSGPMAGRQLEQVSTVVTTWGEWKAAHPDTTIVAEDGGIGRDYPLDPLGGRDDNGPIFPIGDVDPRLPVQEPVLGVTSADGVALAFPVVDATLALEAGEEVELEGVVLALDGGGLRAQDRSGDDLVGHQSFWFAWSQFNPDTALWSRGS